LKQEPQNAAVRRSLCSHYLGLAQTLLDVNDHAAAADIIAQLVKNAPAGWSDQHLAAACLARAADVAAKDEKLPEAKRAELAQTYSGKAMELLRQGAARGFKDADFLARTKDFAALRTRDDFKALTAELEKK
jgi:hypothetical protein